MTAPRSSPLIRSSRATTQVTRCPFCHATLDATSEDWLECEACGALEHRACWRENAGCACCGLTRAVAPKVRPTSRRLIAAAWAVAGAALLIAALDVPGASAMSAPAAARDAGSTPAASLDPSEQQARAVAAEERISAERLAADRAKAQAEERARLAALEAEERATAAAHELLSPAGYWEHSRSGGVATGDDKLDAANARLPSEESDVDEVSVDAQVRIAQFRLDRARARLERARWDAWGDDRAKRLAAAEAVFAERESELVAARTAAAEEAARQASAAAAENDGLETR